MKKFLLFAGETFYPGGGWEDFRGEFSSEEEFEEKYLVVPEELKEPLEYKGYDWSHLVDIEGGVQRHMGHIVLRDEVPKLMEEWEERKKRDYERKMKKLSERSKDTIYSVSGS